MINKKILYYIILTTFFTNIFIIALKSQPKPLISLNLDELIRSTLIKNDNTKLDKLRDSIINQVISHNGIIFSIEEKVNSDYSINLKQSNLKIKDLKISLLCNVIININHSNLKKIDFGKHIFFTGKITNYKLTSTSIELQIKDTDIKKVESTPEYDNVLININYIEKISKLSYKIWRLDIDRKYEQAKRIRKERNYLFDELFFPGKILKSSDLCKFEKDSKKLKILFPCIDFANIFISFDNTYSSTITFGRFSKTNEHILKKYYNSLDRTWFDGELKVLKADLFTISGRTEIQLFCRINSLEPFSDINEINEIASNLTLIPLRKKNKWGFKLRTGKEIIKPQFDNVKTFSENIAGINLNGKWGFIDNKGDIIINPKYDEILDFSDGLAPVCINNKWGYINSQGEIVIKMIYNFASLFVNGQAMVNYKGKKIYINKNGEIIK